MFAGDGVATRVATKKARGETLCAYKSRQPVPALDITAICPAGGIFHLSRLLSSVPTQRSRSLNYLDRQVRPVYHPVGCYRRTFVLRRVQPNGRSPAQGPSWVGSLGVPTFHHCGNCLSLAVLAERRMLPQLLPKLRHHSAGSLGAHSTHRQSRGNGCIPGVTEETGAHSIRTGPRSWRSSMNACASAGDTPIDLVTRWSTGAAEGS